MAFDSALFLTSPTYGYPLTKEAATKLGLDASKWEQEIITAFHEQHPYLGDAEVRIHIHRTDPDSGTLVGQIIVDEKAAVPVIVDKYKIQPFDLFMFEGKVRPLTKEALLDVIQPTTFGKTMEPGMGETSDVSLFNMVQPPFAGKYSFAETLEFTLDEYEKALSQLGAKGLEYALKNCTPFAKVAGVYAVRGMTAEEAERHAEKAPASYRIEEVSYDPFLPIEKAGTYEVIVGGVTKTAGLVFDKVVDLRTAHETGEKMFCSFEGKIALASDFGGRPVAEPGESLDDPLGGYGFFWAAEDGLVATRPMHILHVGTQQNGDEPACSFLKVADAYGGTPLTIYPSSEHGGALVNGSEIFLGKEWHWKKCSPDFLKVADAVTANAIVWPDCAEIRHQEGIWSLHGLDLPEIAPDGETLDRFLAKVGFYMDKNALLALMEKAEKNGSAFFHATVDAEPLKKTAAVTIPPINLIREATAVRPVAEAWFLKTALAVNEEEAADTVDSLLGLNFITPDNTMLFVERIDDLDEAMGVLSKMLLAARMGMSIDQGPIRTALFSLDKVIRQLQHLRSMATSEED
jgi:hypothetical protein